MSSKTGKLITTIGEMQARHKKYQVELKDLVLQEKITL